MSSTNRGYNRHKSDYYVTPITDIEKFMYCFQYDVIGKDTEYMSNLHWLDPCCGGDAFNDASYLKVINSFFSPNNIIGMDIRDDSKADIKNNFIHHDFYNINFDVIISNPPFYLAEEFIKKSLRICNDNGYVVMLLRLNFFGSETRRQLFEKAMPEYCFVHRKRINFIPKSLLNEMKSEGKKPPTGDSIEYAHFVWRKGYNPEYTKLKVI